MAGILYSLKEVLPENVTLLCCFDCTFAHYNPGGDWAFGTMRCHKKIKAQVLQIRDKSDFMDLQERYRDEIHLIQETWHCPEFQLTTPDQWRYI